ncbi:MAG: AAA family ATPase [Anaerolineaceae bacterium]|nr:AAA family ATPase [Anaerolineaceae bacterium]
MPGHLGTCKQLELRYGNSAQRYNRYLTAAAANILKASGCPAPPEDENSKYWPVLFQGRAPKNRSEGNYCWKMRDPVEKAIAELFDGDIPDMVNNEQKEQYEHNMILYGPPGTGKTYNAVNYAVAICESRQVDDIQNENYQDVLVRFNQLKEEGRIAFTTFHQSYGYEEFIEGISPKTNPEDVSSLEYEIRDGLFKAFCKRAQAVKVQSATGAQMKEQPRIWGMILGGTGMTELKKQCFANNEIRLGWIEVKDEDVEGDFIGDEQASWNAKHMVFDFKNSMEVGDIVVIEKNNKSIDAIGIITGEYVYDESHERYPRSRSVEWLVKDIDQDMVPFLPNGRKQLSRFSVFAFDYIGMDVISQIINEHTAESVVDVEQETKPYVFIIDEINRGNISKIFGELITLIEDTKRAGASEAMEARLPYSGDLFSVPQNVYILGTMNTADRSIALMDTALRRRFDFVEMMPDTEILRGIIVEDQDAGVAVEINKMLDAINKRIEILYDREHMIGHAYFMKLKDDPTIENLKEIFLNRIIPLLQEYFYDDYERIQLVLGDNDKEDAYKFIEDKDVKFREFFKGQPSDDVYDEKKIYWINKKAFDEIISYQKIYA